MRLGCQMRAADRAAAVWGVTLRRVGGNTSGGGANEGRGRRGVGVRECGRVGVWACGRVGVRECGRAGGAPVLVWQTSARSAPFWPANRAVKSDWQSFAGHHHVRSRWVDHTAGIVLRPTGTASPLTTNPPHRSGSATLSAVEDR